MIQKLIDLLKSNFRKVEKELKTITDTCCSNISFKVIDFDFVKDEFSKQVGVTEFKDKLRSVDALWFKKNDELLLIEMKRYDNTGALSLEDFLRDRMQKIPCKIVDSILLITAIIGYYNIDKDFYPYFLNPSKLKVKSVFLCNMSKKDYNKADLLLLPYKKISISKRIENNIQFLTCDMFYETYK